MLSFRCYLLPAMALALGAGYFSFGILTNDDQSSLRRNDGSAYHRVQPHPVSALPRVLVYMTSHLDQNHREFLRECWPTSTRTLDLLQRADVLLYTSEPNHTLIDELLSPLAFQNVLVKHYNETYIEPGLKNPKLRWARQKRKQEGARNAMLYPFEHGWFQAYDWVIRLNPDVLIRNDTWIAEKFAKTTVHAIINLFKPTRGTPLVQSDFYAFRPASIDVSALRLSNETNTERHLTGGFQRLMAEDKVAYLLHGMQAGKKAKTVGPNSPVVHSHDLKRHCPDYFRAKDTLHNEF